ncbi:hypothetical protein FBQ96_13310 [Nitrospirales bacterium NOB]|nr:MAG: hypothetical protein UZ03_NOB001002640 [Nitrospira sp. OLB3]MBV6470987.1 hypothetical protein [Nitrospirota bacterium]MCE7965724.1 hypothetical protein [Nitrospira sp. NTP2]MCK6493114.1 hypothetical protein [Nitrospira sp.]MDL1890532.1 hypothetical protein [Nitrospirales bacterium NOB]MEB2340175.1 hypothetical protein [Nitrospirales bacterium]
MLQRLSFSCLFLAIALGAGCAGASKTPLTGAVRYVNIRNEITPRQLIVQVGDEVRWQNLNQHPVRLRLLEDRAIEVIACDKGFSRLGMLDDTVTIPPLQHVSLCFSQPTTVRFNVWLDADDPHGAMTPTGSIRIDPPRRPNRIS